MQLVVRRAGMRPSSRSAEKLANMPVMSLAANHVHFNVQNPTVDSTAWSKESSLNTIPSRLTRLQISIAIKKKKLIYFYNQLTILFVSNDLS